MISEFLPAATYAGPPLIGAFIGYLTNRVAIRMLFRPLKAWRIFGVRVPMTPGVIPSKRHDLAANIGEMVGSHLLTSTEIGTALSTEQFQQHLHNIISNRLAELLDKDLGTLSSLMPESHNAMVSGGLEQFAQTAAARMTAYFSTDEWERQLHETTQGQLEKLGSEPVEVFIDKRTREQLYGLAGQIFGSVLASSETEEKIGSVFLAWFEEGCKAEKCLRQVCPEQLVQMLHGVMGDQAPQLLELMGRQLTEPEVRSKIIQGILGAVDHFLDSLGPMGAMAKGFIDAENLEQSLDTYLQSKEDEILTWLQNPKLIEKVTIALQQHIDGLLDASFADIKDHIGEEKLQAFLYSLAQMILMPFSNQEAGGMQRLIKETCEAFIANGSMTVDSLLEKINASKTIDQKEFALHKVILAVTRSSNIEKNLQKFLCTAGHRLLEIRIGQLSTMIHPSIHEAITEYGVMTLNRVFLKEVPGLVQSLQISQLVTDKINTLDLLKLEQLLLSIMEEQFKYINLFGAMLGFIIGLMNLFLLQLG